MLENTIIRRDLHSSRRAKQREERMTDSFDIRYFLRVPAHAQRNEGRA